MTRDHDALAEVIEAWLDIAPAAEDPGSVLDRVVAELEVTRQQPRSWLAPWSVDVNRFIAVGLATAAVLVAALIGLQMLGGQSVGGPESGDPDPSESPSPSPVPSASLGPIDVSYRDVGFIGLPPLGSAPSGLGSTELLGMYGVTGSAPPFLGAAYVYADGRLIWFEYTAGNPPYSSTGYLEQRLTGAGVELVQALANAKPDVNRGLDFRNLSDRLPATAWEDATIRPYIPPGFGVCVSVYQDQQHEDPAAPLNERLSMLPVEAAELLRGRTPVSYSSAYPEPSSDCLGVPLDEARLLDAMLRTAGLEQDEQTNLYRLEYHADLDGDGPGTSQLNILFEPILPDGTIGCTACG